MIKKVSELVEALIEQELVALEASGITHPPTIGEMYEGLSAEILNMALPLRDTPLKVVRGFIRPSQGEKLSSEIDCMIVVGEGEVVPRTQKFIYPVDQVLITLEVKKTLTREELSKTLVKLNDFKRLQSPMSHNHISDEAFARTIGKRPLFASSPDLLADANELLVDTVISNANLPLRIILDYTGYKTEKGLLTALFEVLIELSEKDHSGTIALPGLWPDLIVGSDFEVVKLFGAPYSVAPQPGSIPLLAISKARFGIVFLESILWRLSSYFDRFLPIYSDFDPPKLARVFSFSDLEGSGKFSYIFPENAPEIQTQIEGDELPKQLTLDEMKIVTMFNGMPSIPLDDPDVFEGLELTAEQFRATVAGLESRGICFLTEKAAFSVYNTLAVGVDRDGPFCGENCRGVLMRNKHRQLAEAAKAAGQDVVPFTHITTQDPLDFSAAVATKAQLPTESILANPGLLDFMRYESTLLARKLLEQGQDDPE